MPDLTIHVDWQCESVEHWETTVTSSDGKKTYTVTYSELLHHEKQQQGYSHGWRCDCKGFQFRQTCKHIEQAKGSGKHCSWSPQWNDMGLRVTDADNPVCPNCGGPVVSHSYGA